MKCRLPNPIETLEQQRAKGRELIRQLREKGYSDKEIAKKLGVPEEKWTKFLLQIGMPFKEYPKKDTK